MVETIDPLWAWQPYQPSPRSPWDAKKVGHLFRRAAFGASWKELQGVQKIGPEKAIDLLLQGGPGQEEFEQQMAPMAESISNSNNDQLAPAWWLYRMLNSPHPLREKLTLFWHNHFATSNAKVQNAGFMLGQYRLMYRNALGNFRTMLQEMSTDPAMLVWLDTNLSKKEKPNENYARELMELFSLGIGHYTETDIRQAARAFTGWRVEKGRAVFHSDQHDAGEKHVLKHKGPWQGRDIVRICLEQKPAAYFIVGKLFRFLVSETLPAPDELLAPLADHFRESDYDFAALVRMVLRSNLFFSPKVYRSRIKSPVEFALGIIHPLEGRLGTQSLAVALEELGQNLFHPPSVKGWDGGQAWLNAQTLLSRQNLALALTSTEDTRFGNRTDPALIIRENKKKSDEELVDFFLELFMQGDVSAEIRARLLHYQKKASAHGAPIYWSEEDKFDYRVRSLCHLVLSLPEFQLA